MFVRIKSIKVVSFFSGFPKILKNVPGKIKEGKKEKLGKDGVQARGGSKEEKASSPQG